MGEGGDKEKAVENEDEDRPKRRRTAEQHSVYERVSMLEKLVLFRHLPLNIFFFFFRLLILFFFCCGLCLS